RRRMTDTGVLDQFTAMFRIPAQAGEFLRALLTLSSRKSASPSEFALKRMAKYVERSIRHLAHGRNGRNAGLARLPLSRKRRRKCALRKRRIGSDRKNGDRQRRDQAAERHGSLSDGFRVGHFTVSGLGSQSTEPVALARKRCLEQINARN